MSSHVAETVADPEGRRRRFPVPVVILAACSLLLFARLGHYALWDDEALTALVAEGVWATGDTTAVIDFRQCRYHGPAMLATVAAAYCYLHRDYGPRREAVSIFALARSEVRR